MHVLVPIDDSDPAMKAVEHAAETYADGTVTLLHVINPRTGMYGDEALYAYEAILESQQEAAADLFERASELAAAHDCDVHTESIIGFPAREIVSTAAEEDADHIVIGSHGRTGPSRVLLGSVAEQVVRRAPCPVTVVR
ncbi:UspA domain protein (plasmid) [Natrialba magadii ATCC 43099]|uniref:UspA domain protein n=1 Tax=Natrialba magadii (strain ATCC 43099 / DSM 3394 / CCM 3739 / CIP 104546 / IAM 13178 / JCM 8861 / NBRC 102185 / NCIMB 2190 / MS3) TaxID=547559 RepID=D3T117_NATMM|nr:universal stress protein [Natrialba magadii]ADD07276.1 UspA domain protein [Natrialba magadii ATCC 43099]ELY34385.1 UspA domain-containing protein [Natrialba magadii ATCC 43099]